MSFILTRSSSHEQPRLASTSCVKGSKECLSGAPFGLCSRPEPRNTGIYFGSVGNRHADFGVLPLTLSFWGTARLIPMEEALVRSCLGPFGCPEPFVLVGALKIALRNRLRRWMFGVGSRWRFQQQENVARWRSWAFHLMLKAMLPFFRGKSSSSAILTPVGCPAVSRVLSSPPICDSELSSDLAHELLPLPCPAVALFLSTHLSSPEGWRRRTAALWVSAVAKAINCLFCAGWRERFVAVFLPCSPFGGGRISPAQVMLGSLKSSLLAKLSLLRGFEKNTRDVSRSFVSWTAGCRAIFSKRRLKLVEQWPSVAPIGHVMTSNEDQYNFIQRGLRLSLIDTVDEADIFRDFDRKLVPDGATGVPKLRRLLEPSHEAFSAYGARLSPAWWTCHFVRASCCCRCDSPLEVCFSFEHNCLYKYWLTTIGSLQHRQSARRQLSALDRRIMLPRLV